MMEAHEIQAQPLRANLGDLLDLCRWQLIRPGMHYEFRGSLHSTVLRGKWSSKLCPVVSRASPARFPVQSAAPKTASRCGDGPRRLVSVFPDHPTGDGESLVYKPPFVDGDIFQGSPDGSLGFEIAEVRGTSGGSWQVRVRSVEEPGMSPWDVTVKVEQESKRCVIDDVIYGSSPSAHSLAASLRRNVKLVQSEVAAERNRSTAHGHSCATVGDC